MGEIVIHPACRPRLVTVAVRSLFQASVASELGHHVEAADFLRKARAAEDALAALPASPEPPEPEAA